MNPKDRVAKTKVPMQLLPPVGPIFGAMACGDGAVKYGPYNWREKPITYMEYLGALKRHIDSLIDGEDCASDSKLPHEAHIIATASILLDARECGTLIDDRPKVRGRAAAVLEKYRLDHQPETVSEARAVTMRMSHWLCMDHGRREPHEAVCCPSAAQIMEVAGG